MPLDVTSLANAVGATVKNVQFLPAAENLPRKILIIGTYNPAILNVVDDTPIQIFSAEDAANRFGDGYMLHRLALQAFQGSQGVETWVVPQSEAGGSVKSTGSIDFTGSTISAGGTINMYIAGIGVPFNVAAAATAADVATAAAAAINANVNLPVGAVVNGGVPEQIDITAKSTGPWGDKITIRFNIKNGDESPDTFVAAITDMSGGSGVPDIEDALNGLGVGDDANSNYFTDVVHGYLLDTSTLDKISTYVGAGNDFVGLYSKTVGRPFRALTGDTDPDTAALNALIAISDTRKLDRANGVLAAPGSANHPSEIAAQAIGTMARINNNRPEQSYTGLILIDVDPGAPADRWTSDYDNRDLAVKSGISPTKLESGALVLQNVVTFYRPDNVPVASNGYRSMRNISIIQNLIENVRLNFSQEKWQGISIVDDTTKVTDTNSRLKARDTQSVIDDLVALARSFESLAWIYSASFTIDKLKEPGFVTIRMAGNGFDNIFPVVLSGEGGIIDTVIEFDTSIAVFL